MKRIVQINWDTREAGNLGGVCKFAWYLKQAVGGESYSKKNNPSHRLRDDVLPVVDGNLTSILPDMPMISVVHGTWSGYADGFGMAPFMTGQIYEQNREWNRKCVVKVAVSPNVARELEKYHGTRADAVILNCVDTELYRPWPIIRTGKPVIIYCADHPNKGCDRISRLADQMKDFEFQYLAARAGEEHIRFNAGDLYLHPSNYEGNSFACLEAMACGLPLVATRIGMFADFPKESPVGLILDRKDQDEDFIRAIRQVYENRARLHPRGWVLQNATFEIFKAKWTEFLGKYL